MTYKGMLLSALLVPVAVTSYGKESVDPRIKQLKEARYQKELELSELGTKIAEKEELLHLMWEKMDEAIAELAEKKNLKKQEFEVFIKEINDRKRAFEKYIEGAFESKEDIRQQLVVELYDPENKQFEYFDRVKFYVVREKLESDLLKTLINSYVERLQELIKIDCEIDYIVKGS